MSAIRVLMLVGADVRPTAVAGYLQRAVKGLEAEWFRCTLVGSVGGLPDEGPARIPLDAGWAWWSHRRELARLQALAQEADLLDLHGYQALLWAARGGLLRSPCVYTRHHAPERRGARQREAWLMGRADAVVAPARDLLPPRLRRAHLVALSEEGALMSPALHPPTPTGRAALRIAVLADGEAPTEVLDALVHRVEGVEWLPLCGAIGRWPPADDPWAAMAEADVILLPARQQGDGALLDGALAAGRPVMAARVPGFVGRFRCPLEGLLVASDDPEAWVEVVQSLVADADWRQALADGARTACQRAGAAGPVRVLQSIYAGVLLSRTGRCPVCPEPVRVRES